MDTLSLLSTNPRFSTARRGARGAVTVACVWASIALSACSDQKTAVAAPAVTPAVGTATGDLPSVLATIDDEQVTLADVRGRAGEQLDLLENQYRRARDKLIGSALDTIVRERLLAEESRKTGKSTEELIAAEMKGSSEASDVEIASWYNDNRARLGGRTLEQLRPQIADLLAKEHRADAVTSLEERLKKEHGVSIAFEPYRQTFDNEGAPSLGPSDAPVTLVEFSDFQCPYCQAAAPAVAQVAQKFGDQVHIVYRQYPIPSLHPFAFKAAEASLCANEQGKFWAMHDAMFQDQTKLAVSDLKATARRLGMDSRKFDACLDAGRYVEQVQNDQRAGQRAGVNGTPAIFINGTYVEGGSVPFSTLQSLIEQELSRIKSKG